MIVLVFAQPALAHDCSSQRDCEQTAGYNAVIALAGGVLALGAGLLGNSLGGGEAAAGEGGEATGEVERGGCLGFLLSGAVIVAALALFVFASLALAP